MNALRRKRLQAVTDQLTAALDELKKIKNEENDCRVNFPWQLRGSIQYQRVNSASESLDSAVRCVNNAILRIEDAVE